MKLLPLKTVRILDLSALLPGPRVFEKVKTV